MLGGGGRLGFSTLAANIASSDKGVSSHTESVCRANCILHANLYNYQGFLFFVFLGEAYLG